MMTVLGFDKENVAKAVEVDVRGKRMDEVKEYFADIGWTSIIFLQN